MAYQKHLYLILYPNYALVASMLPPDQFGKHYTVGSSRYFHGQVIFAEIDTNYRHEYFKLDDFLNELKPKPDGSPKRTKFVKSYRALEHIELSAFRNLYLTSVTGHVLELKQAPYSREHKPGFIRTYQEICPLSMIVLSHMNPPEFGRYITDPDQPKGAPKVFFTQIELDIDRFLREIQENPFLSSPIPNVHPHKLREQILELRHNSQKRLKGISLDTALGRMSILRLRTGFWLAHLDKLIFYPIPDHQTLERDNFEWLRSVSE